MDKFSAKDICAIIKTCCQSNVSELAIGEFSVRFGGSEEENATPLPYGSSAAPRIPTAPSGDMASPEGDSLPGMTKLLSQEEKEIIEELQNSQLMFDDPEAFEQQQIDKYMGNGAATDA